MPSKDSSAKAAQLTYDATTGSDHCLPWNRGRSLSTPDGPSNKVGAGVAIGLFENLFTFEELLLLLRHQYSRKTVYRWIYRLGMPHQKIMGKIWFPKDDVIRWLERSSD